MLYQTIRLFCLLHFIEYSFFDFTSRLFPLITIISANKEREIENMNIKLHRLNSLTTLILLHSLQWNIEKLREFLVKSYLQFAHRIVWWKSNFFVCQTENAEWQCKFKCLIINCILNMKANDSKSYGNTTKMAWRWYSSFGRFAKEKASVLTNECCGNKSGSQGFRFQRYTFFCPFDSVFVCGSQAHRHIAKATQHPYMHIDYACLHSMCTHRPKMYRSLILVG